MLDRIALGLLLLGVPIWMAAYMIYGTVKEYWP